MPDLRTRLAEVIEQHNSAIGLGHCGSECKKFLDALVRVVEEHAQDRMDAAIGEERLRPFDPKQALTTKQLKASLGTHHAPSRAVIRGLFAKHHQAHLSADQWREALIEDIMALITVQPRPTPSREALEQYGQHLEGCGCFCRCEGAHAHTDCTCGFNAARPPPEGGK